MVTAGPAAREQAEARAGDPARRRHGWHRLPGGRYNWTPGRHRRSSGSPNPTPAEARRAVPFEESDQELVERIRGGDIRAFETLHRRYYERIYRLAYLRLGNAEDAADIASQTFCRALQSLHSYQFRRGLSLYPWLHRIASNLVVDAVRARPAGGVLSLDAQAADDVDAFLEYLPADGPSAQDLVERSEVRAAVREAIDKLPKEQGRALTLRFLGDLSIKEIAQALDRSEGAVKSLLHRALVGMRQHLKDGVDAARSAEPAAPGRVQE